jgi:hypothetical protein
VHPLLKVLVEAEAHSAKLAKDVRVAGLVGGKGGRPRGATIAPDRLKVVSQ